MRHLNACLRLFVVLVVPVLVVSSAAAQGYASREYELKAKLFALMPKVVTWPAEVAPSSAKPLRVGVFGVDPFDWRNERGQRMNHLDSVIAQKHPGIVIQHLASVDEIITCHIVFLPADADVETVLASTSGNPVLLVSEWPGAAEKGVSMNTIYDRENNRIRLEINPVASNREGLRIYPSLLQSPLVDIVR